MSDQHYSTSIRSLVSTDNDVESTGHHTLTSSTQILHSECNISPGNSSTEYLKIPNRSPHSQLISVQENNLGSLPSSTYEIVQQNGSDLNANDSNNTSVLWVNSKNSVDNLSSLSTDQDMTSSLEMKMKNRSIHSMINCSIQNSDLIHNSQGASMNAYISRSLPEMLNTQTSVDVHNLPESNEVQLEVSMNSVQDSQAHLMNLSEDKSLNSSLLLNNTIMSVTSYDKGSILNMSNVYSVAPSQVSTSLRSHALTLDTNVHTLHSALVRPNEYEHHSHVNNNSLHHNMNGAVRSTRDVSVLDALSGATTHLQTNDLLTNDGNSLHLPSVDLSTNLMDQMNNINHLTAQENCEDLKFDCLIETLPCYRCKVCPYLSLSKDAVKMHLRGAHSKLLELNSPEEVHNSEQSISEKHQATATNVVNGASEEHNLSKDLMFVCGMCDKVFPFMETCRTHMTLEHDIPADNVQLEPMNQNTLPVHNLIPSTTVLTQQDHNHHHQQQKLPSLLPSLLPKISLVSSSTSSFLPNTCNETQSMTISAPTKRAKGSQKAVSNKQSQPKATPKNKNQNPKCEVGIKSLQPACSSKDKLTEDPLKSPTKNNENVTNSDLKNSSKKRGRPRGSKVAPAKKAGNSGKPEAQKDTRYRCEIAGCTIRMRSIDNMEYHTRSHVGNGFACPECREKFDNWKTMSIHLWRIHVVDMELYTCDICNYKTYSYGKLINMHRRIHSEDRPFLCDTCGKGFKTSKQLRNHRVIHLDKRKHRNLRSGECDICHRRFSDRRMLRVHNDTVHSKLRPYLCSYCGYAASCRSTLKMHIRQHTGEKPFACEKCDYRTADHNSLRRHKMRHSGEKPYRCPFCPYACIQSSTYKTHLKNKHPGMDEGLMFCCPHCSFRTIKKENFITHMVDHKVEQGNKWTVVDSNTDTSAGNMSENMISSGNAEVKIEDSCSYLSGPLSQQEAVVASTLQSQMDGIPQYVFSVQDDVNHGVSHQVMTLGGNHEEKFPILAGQLKLGHISEEDDADSVQLPVHPTSQLEMELVEENGIDRVRHCSDSNNLMQDEQLNFEVDAHDSRRPVHLVTLNPLSPTSILPG